MNTKKNRNELNLLNSINGADLNFEELDAEELKHEISIIQESINNGKINLSPEEEKSLLKELNLIFQHLNSSEDNKSFDVDEIVQDVAEDSGLGVDSRDELNDFAFHDENVGEVDVSDDVVRDVVEDSGLGVDSRDELNDLNLNDFYISDDSSELVNEGIDDVSDDFGVNDENIDEINVSDDLSVDDALTDLVPNYSDEISIAVENVSMRFDVSKDKIDTLKEFVIRTIKRNKSDTRTTTALNNISFEIPKGDRVGIIGFNGAGKSTLLKVLSRVYDPTEGTIKTKGKIAPLLELGAGFDNNYTGRDNIFLNGAFLGYSEDFLKEKYDEILEFSELGDAINYHVKTYSSGMRAKLGFSIATIVEPDILILDEILSVGDIKFRRKSADKIKSLINSGITVLLVSHSVAQIRDLCNKAIWLDRGELIMYGEVNEVCDAYVKAASSATKDQLKNIQLN
ncbi:ABC transporter ATP-binding protein [uncultured Methanobrevibacter sp.]|uniref:ABC transporter ATP-binding protein n=1 Tax=uncultured Methanobrevibacter sp. TaxID=253161 RepID=UPI0025DAF085|nr:ABC transporter ATP-binding protein [uncultured Methanobrevibacter sp.]